MKEIKYDVKIGSKIYDLYEIILSCNFINNDDFYDFYYNINLTKTDINIASLKLIKYMLESIGSYVTIIISKDPEYDYTLYIKKKLQ